MSHFPLVLATAVVLFSSFFPTYFHHLLSPPSLQTLCSPSCPCMCVCVCVVCADPWKVGSSNHKPERSTFSLRWNERNEHFWMKWSRTLHSNPNFFFLLPLFSLPPTPLPAWSLSTNLTVEGGGHSRSLVTSIISEDRFLTLSASVPFWHQGLPLKLFIAHHVAYIRLRCSCVEIL